jgi:hypothetical protein
MDGAKPRVQVVRAPWKLGLKLHHLAPLIVDPKLNGLDFVIRPTPDCKLEIVISSK